MLFALPRKKAMVEAQMLIMSIIIAKRVDLLLAQNDPDRLMIACLMRHGAKIDCWNNKRMKQLRHDRLWDFVAEYCICELECRKSALVYLHCLKRSGIFPRDIRMFMVKLLWRTRRWYDWSPECMERLAKIK
jgi:hypothetical protein